MSTVAEVRLWGRRIGAVAMRADDTHAWFEFDDAFLDSGIEVAPLTMPLRRHVYHFPDLDLRTFHGLPGLLADSLPDKYGQRLIDSWLARQGRAPGSMNAIERLCYTGRRGMGALEFEPSTGPAATDGARLEVDALVELASRVLTEREQLRAHAEDEALMQEILRVGTSAGGARAKAVIAWNPETNEVRSGQIRLRPNFEHWILKFDGVRGNRDKELDDPLGFGAIEFAYYLMATDCGIDMSECRLFEEHGRLHFMSRRFDRDPDGRKIHMQSLGAIAHFDFNLAGAFGYEQALQTTRRLGLGMTSVEQLFRRMAFNIVARNQDDHVKNIAFLMRRDGTWSLSPAFDVTYSFNPDGAWTATHQMTLNGKRDDYTREDFEACGRAARLARGRAIEILDDVIATAKRWPTYAARAALDDLTTTRIGSTHRLSIPAR